MNGDEKNINSERSEYGLGSGTRIENHDIIALKKRIINMMSNSSLKDISDVIMDESKRLTRSKNCYVAYLDQKIKIV